MKQEGNVIFCPITKEEWEAKEKQSDCIRQNVYHCLVDYKGWKWEKCVEQSLIKKRYMLVALFSRLKLCTYRHAQDKFIVLKR